jgi:hypothetical protein
VQIMGSKAKKCVLFVLKLTERPYCLLKERVLQPVKAGLDVIIRLDGASGKYR